MSDQEIITAEAWEVGEASTRFDYGDLPPDIAKAVRASTAKIRASFKRTAEEYLKTGLELIKVRQMLSHGQFGPWLATQFKDQHNLKPRTAENMMKVAERWAADPKFAMIANLPSATLIALAYAPDDVRERFVEAHGRGQRVTGAMVREATKEAKVLAELASAPGDDVWDLTTRAINGDASAAADLDARQAELASDADAARGWAERARSTAQARLEQRTADLASDLERLLLVLDFLATQPDPKGALPKEVEEVRLLTGGIARTYKSMTGSGLSDSSESHPLALVQACANSTVAKKQFSPREWSEARRHLRKLLKLPL